MRYLRCLLGVAGWLALLSVSLFACADPAQADGTWIEVSPARVTAGRHVTLRASCDSGTTTATVTSVAFGTVPLRSVVTFLQAEALVRPTTPDGVHDVHLRCGDGATATTTVWVRGARAATPPMTGPHTGGGFLARRGQGATGADGIARPGPLTGPRGWLLATVGTMIAVAALVAVRLAVVARGPRSFGRRLARPARWARPSCPGRSARSPRPARRARPAPRAQPERRARPEPPACRASWARPARWKRSR